jgi:hypothetical protein
MFYKNGNKYFGLFHDSLFEGKGKFIWKSGKSVSGIFSKGSLIKHKQTNVKITDFKLKEIILDNNIRNRECFIKENNIIKLRSLKNEVMSPSVKNSNKSISNNLNNAQKVNSKFQTKNISKQCNNFDLHSFICYKKILKLHKMFHQKKKQNQFTMKSFTSKPTLSPNKQFDFFYLKKHYSDGDSLNFDTLTLENFTPFIENVSEHISIYSKTDSDISTGFQPNHGMGKLQKLRNIKQIDSNGIGPKLNLMKNKIFAKPFIES